MKRAFVAAVAFALLFCANIFIAQARQGREAAADFTDASLRTVAAAKDNPDVIYVGSDNAVYKSMDAGASWKEVLRIKGTFKRVNFIAVNPANSEMALAATQNGLYRNRDGGTRWEKIFSGTGELERDVLSCGADWQAGVIFIGTRQGLFKSTDAGRTWQREDKGIVGNQIRYIALPPFDKNLLLIATEGGAFKSEDAGAHWQRVFVASASEPEDADTENLDDIDAEEYLSRENQVNAIAFDAANRDVVYLGTEDGVFISEDGCQTWRRLPAAGLLSSAVKFIAAHKGDLYAATAEGAFQYSVPANRWTAIDIRAAEKDVRWLDIAGQYEALWLVTKSQVINYRIKEALAGADEERHNFLSDFKNEPTIKEVQEVAIKYAEVHPAKISSWRKQARLKAVMPTLSGKFNNNVTDLYDWETGSTTIKNDNILNKGENALEWEASLSWDLGDLVWSTDQTSIDVRSRLMVQLRDDILDQVNRTYFERRRLQYEMFASPPKDERSLIEKELRLEELTADLDGLTGGYFSEAVAARR